MQQSKGSDLELTKYMSHEDVQASVASLLAVVNARLNHHGVRLDSSSTIELRDALTKCLERALVEQATDRLPLGTAEYGSQAWLDAIDYPDAERAEIQKNRAKALELGVGNPKNRGYSGGLSIGPRGGVKRGSSYLGRR
jgi:hypothetical protein